jgi:hypothetical protein
VRGLFFCESEVTAVIKNLTRAISAPGFSAYTRNPTGKDEPAWLQEIYRRMNEYMRRCEEDFYRAVEARDIRLWEQLLGAAAKAPAIFDALAMAQADVLAQAPADLTPDLLASVLGLTPEALARDIEAGLVPVLAGTNRTTVDTDLLGAQMAAQTADLQLALSDR